MKELLRTAEGAVVIQCSEREARVFAVVAAAIEGGEPKRIGKAENGGHKKLKKYKTGKANRNKKCRKCGREFYDETQTNCRKWCGPGGCKCETAPGKGADGRPRDRNGKAVDLRETAPDED